MLLHSLVGEFFKKKNFLRSYLLGTSRWHNNAQLCKQITPHHSALVDYWHPSHSVLWIFVIICIAIAVSWEHFLSVDIHDLFSVDACRSIAITIPQRKTWNRDINAAKPPSQHFLEPSHSEPSLAIHVCRFFNTSFSFIRKKCSEFPLSVLYTLIVTFYPLCLLKSDFDSCKWNLKIVNV